MVDYCLMHVKLGSYFEFEFEHVCNYQLLADRSFDNYNMLTGQKDMTNYFHLHKAGHRSYFLLKLKTFYKYLQEGYKKRMGL